jgi:hypothetical protein
MIEGIHILRLFWYEYDQAEGKKVTSWAEPSWKSFNSSSGSSQLGSDSSLVISIGQRGLFNHEKGAIWQTHLAAQKEGVVATIIFSDHKTY